MKVYPRRCVQRTRTLLGNFLFGRIPTFTSVAHLSNKQKERLRSERASQRLPYLHRPLLPPPQHPLRCNSSAAMNLKWMLCSMKWASWTKRTAPSIHGWHDVTLTPCFVAQCGAMEAAAAAAAGALEHLSPALTPRCSWPHHTKQLLSHFKSKRCPRPFFLGNPTSRHQQGEVLIVMIYQRSRRSVSISPLASLVLDVQLLHFFLYFVCVNVCFLFAVKL